MIEEVKRLPAPPFKRSIKIKAKKWLKRFLPAEFIGALTAVATSSVAHHSTKNLIVGAYARAIGETLGFYTTIVIQDVLVEKRKLNSENKTLSFKNFIYILRNILMDFGFAESYLWLVYPPLFYVYFSSLDKELPNWNSCRKNCQ